jgi:hypothetical protein
MKIELDALLELVWETASDEDLSKIQSVLAKWLDTVEDEIDYVNNQNAYDTDE